MTTTTILTSLYRFIIEHYDLDELRTLCFGLGVDYDSLAGEGKAARARELLLYTGRQRQLEQLLKTVSRERPAGFNFDLSRATIEALYEQLPSFEDTSLPAPLPPANLPSRACNTLTRTTRISFSGARLSLPG